MNSSIERQAMNKSIDREKNCPLLLRVFLSQQHHHLPNDFARGLPPNELQIYTWLDASLKELTNLIKEVNEESRKKGTIFDFAFIYPDPYSSSFKIRKVGETLSGQSSNDDNLTLASCKFQIGDFLDVCIIPPHQSQRGDRLPERDRIIDRRRDHRNHRY